MLISLDDFHALLRSPVSGAALRPQGEAFVAEQGQEIYPTLGGKPILIDFDRSVFLRPEPASEAQSVVDRPRHVGPRRWLKRLVSPPKPVTEANVAEFIRLLLERTALPTVLVIGGGTIGQSMAGLYDHPQIRIIALDVYASPMAQLIADAHHLPLRSDAIDGVVAQAVLEHVLEPERVVDEIWRVLAPGGLVYAETPFLQQVHEGAYDFTRFTASGHRWLFRRFDAIRTGVCGGAGTQLLWSIDYFARGLFRSVRIGKAFKLMFFWLSWLDPLVPEPYAVDSASGFFLMGRKSDATLRPRDIIGVYNGAGSKGSG